MLGFALATNNVQRVRRRTTIEPGLFILGEPPLPVYHIFYAARGMKSNIWPSAQAASLSLPNAYAFFFNSARSFRTCSLCSAGFTEV